METSHVIAGRYRLLDRLGAGGMSVVWRAHDDVLDREVAVKLLSPDLAADADLLHRIHVEARAAARLHHPNVVEVHDYGETEESLPYVVMELVDGRSLADLLTGGALQWRLAVLVCAQVAAALSAAHGRGIVHRDVKPSNVMVTSSGVKLVDFGISATVGEADVIGGELVGTPAYLAPERLVGGSVRPATDVYAMGLLLYLTLAGRLPWEASTTTQMLTAHRYLEPAVLPPVRDLPPEVADLCRRCLEKDPADRPDAAEVARILAETAGIAPPVSLLPPAAPVSWPGAETELVGPDTELVGPGTELVGPDTERVRTPSPRRRILISAGTAAVLLAAGAAVWWGDRDAPPAAQAMAEAPAAALQCTVRYAVRSARDGRFSTAVTVVNTGTVAAGRWHLTFTLPDGQRLIRGTGWRQDGQSLRFGGTELAAGASASTGFDATYRTATTLPVQFRLNDTVCAAELSVAGGTTQPTRHPPTTTPARTGVTGAVTKAQPAGVGNGKSGKEKSGKAKGKDNGKGKGKGKD